MPDPVLRIPVDDAAFKRYMEAFQRYQEQLNAQPEMWHESNEATRDGIAANLSLADAIGESVAAAVRLGDAQERNAQRRRRDAQEENAEAARASDWRRKSLDHVQELSRTTASVVRGFASFATGGGGGLFGGISSIGKTLGGTAGGIVNLAGHVLNAGYEINSAVSDKGQFARGIGASISEQEGFHNNLGRYTNTDQGIDAVMNARGDPTQWAQFSMLGVKGYRGDKSNAQVYADVLRSQVDIARRNTHHGVTDWFAADPRGASAFGTTHEDLNRLMKAPDLNKAIQDAASFKSALGDKQTDAATKSVVAMDNLTTRVTDAAQAMTVAFDPALDKATKGLNDLYDVSEKIVGLFSGWNNGPTGRFFAEKPKDNGSASGGFFGGFFGNAFGDSNTSATASDRYVPHALDSVMQGMGNNGGGAATSSGGNSRADRNKNPGNLKNGAFARGQAGYIGSDGVFAKFDTAEHGYAAQERLLQKNYLDKGYNTLATIIAKYAPSSDHNNPSAYATRVARELHTSINAVITPNMLSAVARAMSHVEGYHGGAPSAHGGSRGASASHVNVKVSVTAPPGHQTAVVANGAARGG